MQKKFLRILSLFLVLIMVSLGFMQPIVYANAVVAGGALVLLVVGLLITCGMTFTNQAQAEAVANHAIAQMPPELRTLLTGNLAGIDFASKPTFSMLMNGFATSVMVTGSAFVSFKTWFNDFFGVNAETVTAGDGVAVPFDGVDGIIPDGARIVHNGTILPELRLVEFKALGYEYFLVTYSSSYSGYFLFLYFNKPYFKSSSNSLQMDTKPTDTNGNVFFVNDRRWSFSEHGNIWPQMYAYSYISHTLSKTNVSNVIFSNFNILDQTGSIFYDIQNNVPLTTAVPISQEAYNYTIPESQESVSIAITNDVAGMTEKDFLTILEDYSLENWDYSGDLAALQQTLDSIAAELGQSTEYEALLVQCQALGLELDAVRDLVAAQGVEAVGGTVPLDDAMVDVALLVALVQDLVAAQELDAVTIANLVLDLEKAKEGVIGLTDGSVIDVPINPPIVDAKEGIQWSRLQPIETFDLFPFCLPKDVYMFFTVLAAPPIAPYFEFDIFAGKFGDAGKIVIDFKEYDDIRKLVRSGFLILYIIGLMGATKKFIWSGGG